MDQQPSSLMTDFSIKGHSLGKWERLLPESGKMSVPPGTTVKNVLDRFNFPPELRKVFLLFVNGRPQKEDYALQPGDALVVFPPLEGG
jgi:sulfur carrier protein ThiS